jgi:G3E family GTPase
VVVPAIRVMEQITKTDKAIYRDICRTRDHKLQSIINSLIAFVNSNTLLAPRNLLLTGRSGRTVRPDSDDDDDDDYDHHYHHHHHHHKQHTSIKFIFITLKPAGITSQ